MHNFEQLLEIFEQHLSKENFSNEPEELYAPISYTLALGGKRIRPVLTLMACEMFGGDIKEALHQAVAIELFHKKSI